MFNETIKFNFGILPILVYLFKPSIFPKRVLTIKCILDNLLITIFYVVIQDDHASEI